MNTQMSLLLPPSDREFADFAVLAGTVVHLQA